jgi:DNA-binding CsgD family transcriptional regulator
MLCADYRNNTNLHKIFLGRFDRPLPMPRVTMKHNSLLEAGTDQKRLARTILDSLSAHIAILDKDGYILATNKAWREFASSNQLEMRSEAISVNYLEICDSAVGESSEQAGRVAEGIRAVLSGGEKEFLLDYPCHSPDARRWFYMRVTPIPGGGAMRAVVSHENITALKLAEESIRIREQELEEKTRRLEETNTALKVILRQREEDKQLLEERMLRNVKELVKPYVDRLKNSNLKPAGRELVDIIDRSLEDLASPLLQRLSAAKLFLTPQEVQVAQLVKDGKSSKEIAGILNVSVTTVSFHRKNLRKKLGLGNRQTNLRTYLLSMED